MDPRMNTSPGSNYLDDLSDELALALGQAVWAFARIEWLTYEYMKTLSTDSLDELMGDQFFKSRVRLIRQLVDRVGSKNAKVTAIAAIDHAERLADRRNILVHNPWQIWVDLERRNFMTEIQKYNKRERKLDLSAVKQFTKEAMQAAQDLQSALSALTIPSS